MCVCGGGLWSVWRGAEKHTIKEGERRKLAILEVLILYIRLRQVTQWYQYRRCKRCGFDPCVGKIPWRRKWQPTPVFLPGESHGQRSLESYSPWGCKELDSTERMCTHTHRPKIFLAHTWRLWFSGGQRENRSNFWLERLKQGVVLEWPQHRVSILLRSL